MKKQQTILQSVSPYKASFYIINLKFNGVYEIDRCQFCKLPGVPPA